MIKDKQKTIIKVTDKPKQRVNSVELANALGAKLICKNKFNIFENFYKK